MKRKQFLKFSSRGAAFLMLSPSLAFCSQNKRKPVGNGEPDPKFKPDVDVELTSTTGNSDILPGNLTDIYHYTSKVLKGENSAILENPESYIGPIIRVKKGDRIRIRYKNELPGESIIHWHGLHIPPEMDGHPEYAINKGEEYIYEFTVNNPSGTYWFHPHPDKITGPQVYNGLAGMFIVEDNSGKLPKGKYDIPIIIQDRTFDSNNQLVYLSNNRMAQMQGFLGDEMLINGKISKEFKVDRRPYRFRILNGSNSRIYKLAWNDDSALHVIATDGGLLRHPVDKPYLMLAPGERVEIWKDFSSYEPNHSLKLVSLPFRDGSSMGMGRMGGMMNNMGRQGNEIYNGQGFDLAKLTINNSPAEQGEIPDELTADKSINKTRASNAGSPRQFHFFNDHMQWVINGKTFEMQAVADWETVKAGSTEIWQFINGNNGRGMGMMQNMMQMPHPVHIHGFSFQIVNRDISGMDPSVWETVKDGFLDQGLQDTFLLMPGMKVNVLISFQDFTGKYIYHCHNLEHEDMGMMRNFEIIN